MTIKQLTNTLLEMKWTKCWQLNESVLATRCTMIWDTGECSDTE